MFQGLQVLEEFWPVGFFDAVEPEKNRQDVVVEALFAAGRGEPPLAVEAVEYVDRKPVVGPDFEVLLDIGGLGFFFDAEGGQGLFGLVFSGRAARCQVAGGRGQFFMRAWKSSRP